MQLSLRRRLFLAMVGLATFPLAVALVVLAAQVWSAGSPSGPRAALDEIAASGHTLMSTVDTTLLDAEGREAIEAHAAVIARRTSLARRAETLSRYAAGALGVVILVVTAILIVTSLALARRWSTLVSAPIEELVDWVGRIQSRQSLPTTSEVRGAAEFGELRSALRGMSAALEHARDQELEQERLRAFRETARRVAHEMRGPLSAARLAIRQLGSEGSQTAAEVLAEETERLERMAQEFSEFGRLPEGPEAEIDLSELLESVVAATVPPELPTDTEIPAGIVIRGHYEPLRRAFQNLVSNAAEVTTGQSMTVRAQRSDGRVRVTISDHGPGVPRELRSRIFEPYFTTKRGGTGLGLAMVRQTVIAHGGSVEVSDAAGAGACFVVTLPEG